MVGVVVHHGCTVRHFAHQLEPAGRAGEFVQALFRRGARHAEKLSRRAAGQRVEHIVPAGHRELDPCVFLPLHQHGEAVVAVLVADVLRAHIGVFVQAERADAAVQPVHTAHGVGVVPVDHDQAVHRRQLDERAERVDDVVQVLEKVEVVLLHVEHDRDRRRKAQERIAVFAAFSHKAALAADAQRAADGGQVAADHDRRVKAGLHGHQRHHRGRGGLAVRARETHDVIIVAHQVAPCLGALHHRDAQLVRTDNLGVIIVHSRGAHDERRALDVFRPVLIGDLRTQRFQTRSDVGMQPVRAGYRHAAAEQQLSERIHRHAADADQVDAFLIINIGFDRQRHFPMPPAESKYSFSVYLVYYSTFLTKLK